MITPEQLAKSGSEHGEQSALFCWATNYAYSENIPELWLLFAIPNGFYGDSGQKGKMKAEGLKSGVPDTMLPVARKGFNGCFIEMKRKNGKPSDVSEDQNKWIDALRAQGYYATVCYGWIEARDMLLQYLGREQV